ncbi:uncharacterized protein [Rutidosis leptorrhynchoides]|uniref:uncharacterized protein n=1 Tax=Rutidosis leptorrhynchoides TaxID=125765 RepID=UPI003A9A26D4
MSEERVVVDLASLYTISGRRPLSLVRAMVTSNQPRLTSCRSADHCCRSLGSRVFGSARRRREQSLEGPPPVVPPPPAAAARHSVSDFRFVPSRPTGPSRGGEGSSRNRGRRGDASLDEDYIVPPVRDYHVFNNMDGPNEVTNRRIPGAPELYNGDPNNIKLGMHFSNKKELNGAIAIWSTRMGREVRTTKSDKVTWAVECVNRPNKRTKQPYDGIICQWKARALFRSEYRTWQITVWCDGHNCEGAENDREDRNISQGHVAYVIMGKIRDKPNYPIKAIVEDCEAAIGCKIGRKKAWDGKRVAMNQVYEDRETNFRQLPGYMRALQNFRDGTKVQWKFKKEDGIVHSRRKIFRYIFWHFSATRLTFEHSHPVVTVDATYLRGSYKGKAIVAVVKTANDRVVPIAYAIIDEESNHSWYWFLKYLKLHVLRHTFTCIISDRNSGILSATAKLDTKFPNCGVHRYCMEHIRANMLSNVPKKAGLYALSWTVGTELDEAKYNQAWTDLIELSPSAAMYLQRIPLQKWTLILDGFYRWGTTTSDDVESYNNVLRGDRYLPIRAFVQATHAKVMAIFVDEMSKINRYRYALVEKPMAKFEANKLRSRRYDVSLYPNAPGRVFNVKAPPMHFGVAGNEHTVQFDMGSCSCLHWNTYRIPCSHAMAVAKELHVRRLDLVHTCYTRAGWRQQFSGVFAPLPNPWPESDFFSYRTTLTWFIIPVQVEEE